ncbi:MAG: hypothetical protein N3G78_14775 [Desulfobacterota bacterium]|nr:hypothetical protein [Thermodesulfobacteriota bacterium]
MIRKAIVAQSEETGLLRREIEADDAYFVGRKKGTEVEEHREKSLFSASWSEVAW